VTVLFAYGGGANSIKAFTSNPATDPHSLGGWCFVTSLTNVNELFEMNSTVGGFSFIGGGTGSGVGAGQVMFRLSNSTGSANTDIFATCSQNAWHHVFMTYDGTTFRTYVDGVPTGTATPGYGTRTGTWDLSEIGPCDATLSDAVFYTAALSAADVLELYARRQPIRRNNIMGSYPMFADTSATWGKDYSGLANDLTVTGTLNAGLLQPPAQWSGGGLLVVSGALNFNIPSTGGVRTDGSATMTASAALLPSGQTATAGTATLLMSAPVVATGGARTDGSVVMTSNVVIPPPQSGGIFDPRRIVKKPWRNMRSP
jgi:hypothetical protein